MSLRIVASSIYCLALGLAGCGGSSPSGTPDAVSDSNVSDSDDAARADAADDDAAPDTNDDVAPSDTGATTDTADEDVAATDTTVAQALRTTFSVTFDDGTDTATGYADESFPFTASYDVAMDGCPGCLVQVLVAVNAPATVLPAANVVPLQDIVQCIYHGVPGSGGKQGTYQGKLSVGAARDYPIYMAAALATNCDDAIAAYHARALAVAQVGTFTGTPAPERVSDIRIAGGGARNDVVAGSYFDVEVDYAAFERCSGCRSSLTLGIGDVGQACIYDGAAGPAPGVGGTATVRLRAPDTELYTEILWDHTEDGTCGAGALSRFAGLLGVLSPNGALENWGTRLCLDMPASTATNGAALSNYACGGTDNQRFDFVHRPASDDWQIRLVHSDLCLDVEGSGQPNGTRIVQYTCTDTPNQRWTLYTERGLLALRPQHASGASGCLTAGDGQSGSTVSLQPCADPAVDLQTWNLQHFRYGL